MGVNDVKVYERSYKAALAVYRVSKRFPKEETYGLTSQIRRAATGIPLNIAEGYAKKGKSAGIQTIHNDGVGFKRGSPGAAEICEGSWIYR